MTAPPHTPAEFTESWLARAGRLCWLTVVVATVLFWAAWWFLMPGGFETNHPRFWANSVAPVIGLVQVGAQARADRYTYMPTIGISIMLAWGAAEVVTRLPRAQAMVTALAARSNSTPALARS